MNKKGQGIFGVSFGVIFSIIIIIAIISVAVYTITYFLGLNKCTQVGLFFNDLQEEIDDAWQAQYHDASYTGTLPSSGILISGAEEVCFGSLTATTALSTQQIQKKLREDFDANTEHNVFIFPPDKVCNGDFYSTKLAHVNPSIGFFCVIVSNGKVPIRLEKKQSEVLVTIKP